MAGCGQRGASVGQIMPDVALYVATWRLAIARGMVSSLPRAVAAWGSATSGLPQSTCPSPPESNLASRPRHNLQGETREAWAARRRARGVWLHGATH